MHHVSEMCVWEESSGFEKHCAVSNLDALSLSVLLRPCLGATLDLEFDVLLSDRQIEPRLTKFLQLGRLGPARASP